MSLNNINWPEVFTGGFIGFLTALLTASIYEWVRRPNLIFTVDTNSNEGERRIKSKDYKWKFLNIVVENPKRPWWQSWFWGNLPAENTRAWVSFRDYETDTELKKISARWATTKQPLNDFGRPDWSSLLVTSRDSIPVNESASMAVAIKTNESESVYGFNNESYAFYPEYNSPYDTLWSNPEFETGNDKKYKICVKVLTNGHEYTEEFLLLNPRKTYKSISLAKEEKQEC